MKRGFLWFFICFTIFFGIIPNVYAIGGTGAADYNPTGNCRNNSCWYNVDDLGFRFTIVNSNGQIVSGTNSVDYFSSGSSKSRGIINTGNYDNIKGYKKGNSDTKISFVNLQGIKVTSSGLGSQNNSQLKDMFFKALKNGLLNRLLTDTKFKGDYRNFNLFIEPLYIVSYNGRYKIGTGTSLVRNGIVNKDNIGLRQSFLYNAAFNLYLPTNITSMGLNKVIPTNSCNSNKICFRYTSAHSQSMPDGEYFINKMKNNANGYSVYVINFSEYSGQYDPRTVNISCPITVNINECGNSTIIEPSSGDCLKNNPLYEEITDCKLYCSDTIETDFNGFYNTFIGSNNFSAIQSGKYISISGNPKITIKKTCYQASGSTNCPNWQSSLTNKLKNDYRANTVALNVDGDNNSGRVTGGHSYTLSGTPTISVNSSGATIVYEYKLDPNVNKYISIAEMRGVDVQSSNTIELISDNGTIITKVASYGDSKYYLDLSNTVLNKYNVSGKRVAQTKHATTSLITIFKNTLSINYKGVNNATKTSYTSTHEANVNSNDMYYECGYKKYNGCIGEENKCYDPISCSEVPCTYQCTSPCGCKDDGKCTPIACPPTDGTPVCDPEQETCFPNVVYRPISLKDPFPGISGNGRIPGDNWNKLVRNSDGALLKYNGNTVTAYDYYIKYNRGYNDYEIYQTEPLYVIKLDSKKIKEIRNYNKAHGNNYNDFELSCQNGEKCISKFLRDYNLIDSGTCKGITASTFDSCISRKP